MLLLPASRGEAKGGTSRHKEEITISPVVMVTDVLVEREHDLCGKLTGAKEHLLHPRRAERNSSGPKSLYRDQPKGGDHVHDGALEALPPRRVPFFFRLGVHG